MTEVACQIFEAEQPAAEWMDQVSFELLVIKKEQPIGNNKNV